MTQEELQQNLGRVELEFVRWRGDARTRIEKLEADLAHSSEAFTGLLSRLDNYESRLKVLEEARQRQIAFNATVSLKEAKKDEKKEVKSFWERFK